MLAFRWLYRTPGTHDSPLSVHNIHWRPQFYICDVCRLNYDLIFHSEDEMDLKNSIIEKLNLGLQLMSRDEYYEVDRQNHPNFTSS